MKSHKISLQISLFILIMAFYSIGCERKPQIEGVLLDNKGKPIINRTIVAKPVSSDKDIQPKSAATDKNGSFSIKGLSFGVEYIIEPVFSEWQKDYLWHFKYETDGINNYFNNYNWWASDILKKLAVKFERQNKVNTLETTISIYPYNCIVQGKIVNARNEPISELYIKSKPKNKFVITNDNPFGTCVDKNGKFDYSKLKQKFPNQKNKYLIREDSTYKAKTDEAGNFVFDNLIPNTKYQLFNQYHEFYFEFETPEEGETLVVKAFSIRFLKSGTKSGPNLFNRELHRRRLIHDTLTGLEWVKMDDNIGLYVDSSWISPEGWRNPTVTELKTLFDPTRKHHRKIHPIFQMDDLKLPYRIWSGESDIDRSLRYCFDYYRGKVCKLNPMRYGCTEFWVRNKEQ